MAKFIITYEDGRPCIISMDSCTDCPLMKFKKADFECECRSYFGKNGNILQSSVAAFDNQTERVYQSVDIPNWCLLSDDIYNISENIFDIFPDRIVVKPYEGDVNKLRQLNGFDLEEFENNSEVESSPFIVATDDIIIESSLGSYPFKSQEEIDMDRFFDSIGGSSEFDGIDLTDYWAKHDTYKYPVKKNYSNVCSMCGHTHDSVERNSNNGICCDCLLECVDIESKKQAYIKNFRLKREIEFTNEQFKIII